MGIAGLTLGGGKCHLMPKDCAACDKSAVRENSDGRLETDRSQSEIHSRILWAIRGGGGYFGVATALEDQLHPDSLKRLQSTQKQLLNQAAFCRSAHRSGGRHSRARA